MSNEDATTDVVLAPCMFCGSSDVEFLTGLGNEIYCVECQVCDAKGPSANFVNNGTASLRRELADQWNAAANAAASWRWIQSVVDKTGFIDFGSQ